MSTGRLPLSLPLTLLAAGVALVFIVIAFIHVYWSLGGRRGATVAVPQTAGGTRVFIPSSYAIQSVAILLVFAAHLLSGRFATGTRFFPDWVYVYGLWFLFAVFVLRVVGDFRFVGLFKRERTTEFARYDTRFYTPLCLFFATALFFIARA